MFNIFLLISFDITTLVFVLKDKALINVLKVSESKIANASFHLLCDKQFLLLIQLKVLH